MGCVGGSPRTRHTPRDTAARGARGSLWTRGESLLLLTLEQKKDKTHLHWSGPRQGSGQGAESLGDAPKYAEFPEKSKCGSYFPLSARQKKERKTQNAGRRVKYRHYVLDSQ